MEQWKPTVAMYSNVNKKTTEEHNMARVVSSEHLEDSAIQFCLKTVMLALMFLAKTSHVTSYDSRFMLILGSTANYFTRTCHILVIAKMNVSTVYFGLKT